MIKLELTHAAPILGGAWLLGSPASIQRGGSGRRLLICKVWSKVNTLNWTVLKQSAADCQRQLGV